MCVQWRFKQYSFILVQFIKQEWTWKNIYIWIIIEWNISQAKNLLIIMKKNLESLRKISKAAWADSWIVYLVDWYWTKYIYIRGQQVLIMINKIYILKVFGYTKKPQEFKIKS